MLRGLAANQSLPKLKRFLMEASSSFGRQDEQNNHSLAVNLFSPKVKPAPSEDNLHTRGISREPAFT